MHDNQALINTINKYSKNKTPFFFLISYNLKKYDIIPLNRLCKLNKDIKVSINKKNNFLNKKATNVYVKDKNTKDSLELKIKKRSFAKYNKKFNKIIQNIKKGNIYICNLTSITQIKKITKLKRHSKSIKKVNLKDIFYNSVAKYKLYYKNKFISFSPESFIQIKNNKIYSFPMKGTIKISDFKNKIQAKEALKNNKKEISEHFMVVDLIRNDLSAISKNVAVDKFRYIKELNTISYTNNKERILQTSSKISGNLDANWHKNLGDIIVSLLPAGSITGAPKKRCCEIIKKTEQFKRDYFTGIWGIYDGESLDSCVLIRFIEKTKNGFCYKSGGGITYESKAKKEYKELHNKIYIPQNTKQKNKKIYFESIKCKNYKAYNLKYHQKRINKTIKNKKIRLDNIIPPSKELIKCKVVYNKNKVLNISYEPYTPKDIKTFKLVYDDDIKYSKKSIDRKCIDRLDNTKCDEIIIVKNNLITDTSIANIAIFYNNTWLTPKKCLLKGTMRAKYIKKGVLKPFDINVNMLKQAKKIALLNAMIGFRELLEYKIKN